MQRMCGNGSQFGRCARPQMRAVVSADEDGDSSERRISVDVFELISEKESAVRRAAAFFESGAVSGFIGFTSEITIAYVANRFELVGDV